MRVGVFNGVTLLCVLQRPPPSRLAQEPSPAWTPPSAWWLLHLLRASLSETHLPVFLTMSPCMCGDPGDDSSLPTSLGSPWPTEALSLPYPPMSLSCSATQMMPKLLSHRLVWERGVPLFLFLSNSWDSWLLFHFSPWPLATAQLVVAAQNTFSEVRSPHLSSGALPLSDSGFFCRRTGIQDKEHSAMLPKEIFSPHHLPNNLLDSSSKLKMDHG